MCKGIPLIIAFILLVGSSVFPCYAEEPKVVKPIYNIFSDEEEVAIGRDAVAEFEKGMPLLRDRLLEGYLDYVAQKVAQTSRRSNLRYEFKVVDTLEINAYALPGGFVYVTRGMLEFVEKESELIAVLGHEIGHVAAYHGTNEVSRQVLLERVLEEGKKVGVLNDQELQSMVEQLGGAVLLFVRRKFSRDEETEADLLGFYNAARAGWNPQGMLTLFARMQALAGKGSLLEQLLATHPFVEERLQLIRSEQNQLSSPPDLANDSLMFKAAKARMMFLPPSPNVKP